jgi:thioredoxin reductase (NADPH)
MDANNLIIIGSGPAGLTAAIYAARGNLKPIVFAGYNWGGQLMTTTEIENFPGFPEAIPGPKLIQNMVSQAERFGATIHYKDIVSVDFSDSMLSVNDAENTYHAKAIIVATGARPRKLGVPGEDRYWSKGVSSCATCDGAFFKNKIVAVVGGGDSAMEEAIFLTNFATKVYLIHRRNEFRASKIMAERALANPKIETIMNTVVSEVVGENLVTGLRLQNLNTGVKSEMPVDDVLHVDGLFLGVGNIPETELFKDKLSVDELGYLLPTKDTMSNIPGVFIAGDVADHRYRQAITAAAEGCKAAIDAQRWLETEH